MSSIYTSNSIQCQNGTIPSNCPSNSIHLKEDCTHATCIQTLREPSARLCWCPWHQTQSRPCPRDGRGIAFFEELYCDEAEVSDRDDGITITVTGQYNGSTNPAHPQVMGLVLGTTAEARLQQTPRPSSNQFLQSSGILERNFFHNMPFFFLYPTLSVYFNVQSGVLLWNY
jgi:hypothetical protein